MTVTTPKIFDQAKPPASGTEGGPTTITNLYTVPSGRQAQVTIFVCNQSNNLETFRIAIVQSGATMTEARYLSWDTPIVANGVFSFSGIGLNSGESIKVRSQYGFLSFTATGIELS
jgi:hypothetical protein